MNGIDLGETNSIRIYRWIRIWLGLGILRPIRRNLMINVARDWRRWPPNRFEIDRNPFLPASGRSRGVSLPRRHHLRCSEFGTAQG